MPLDESCEAFVNAEVYILPVHGYGWCRIDDGSTPISRVSVEVPPPFWVRISDLARYRNRIAGGAGVISRACQELSGQWVGFVVRDALGEINFDLSTRIAEYNVRIGATKPKVDVQPEALPMPEWIRFEGPPFLSGLAFIADRAITLDDVLRR
jgi:hypothetical protein